MTVDFDLERAVRYPTESEEWVKTVLLGGVLLLFSWLIIPLILVYGYLIRVLRAGMNDDPQPPAFDEWGELFSEGLPTLVIAIVYGLIPLIVFGVTVGGSVLAFATGSRAGAGLGLVGLLGGLVLTFILSIVFGYFGFAAVANYAHEGTLGAGFDIGVITDVSLDRAYAVPWLYGFGLIVAASILTGVLNSIPILGAILGLFVTFYALIAGVRFIGMGYAEARNLGPADSPTTEAMM
jgi:hypothetical protein